MVYADGWKPSSKTVTVPRITSGIGRQKNSVETVLVLHKT